MIRCVFFYILQLGSWLCCLVSWLKPSIPIPLHLNIWDNRCREGSFICCAGTPSGLWSCDEVKKTSFSVSVQHRERELLTYVMRSRNNFFSKHIELWMSSWLFHLLWELSLWRKRRVTGKELLTYVMRSRNNFLSNERKRAWWLFHLLWELSMKGREDWRGLCLFDDPKNI